MNCENIFYSQQTEISKLMSGELIKKQKKGPCVSAVTECTETGISQQLFYW